MKESLSERLAQIHLPENLSNNAVEVFRVWVDLYDPESGYVPNNKRIAQELGISRGAAKRARRELVTKIEELKPGF